MGNADEKYVYLTFDEGYEAGYTEKILDVLKENDVKAAFFITGHYLNTASDLVKRMIDQGHIVGNHTVNHKSMPDIDDNKIKEEQTQEPIILHTDQGSVYSSKNYNNLLNEFNIQRSMSRAGTPTDNPVNESLNGWIKEELIIDFDLKHCEDVPNLIKLYINYYNNERPSYALNYKTPIQYKIESGF